MLDLLSLLHAWPIYEVICTECSSRLIVLCYSSGLNEVSRDNVPRGRELPRVAVLMAYMSKMLSCMAMALV